MGRHRFTCRTNQRPCLAHYSCGVPRVNNVSTEHRSSSSSASRQERLPSGTRNRTDTRPANPTLAGPGSMPASATIRSLLALILTFSTSLAYDSLEVMEPFVRIHTSAGDSFPFLILAEKGRRFRILDERSSWCRVLVDDTAGWVRKRHARPWPQASPVHDSTAESVPSTLGEPPVAPPEDVAEHAARSTDGTAVGPMRPRRSSGEYMRPDDDCRSRLEAHAHTQKPIHPSEAQGTHSRDPVSDDAKPLDWAAEWYGFADDGDTRFADGDTTDGQASAVAPDTALVVRSPVAVRETPDSAARALRTIVPGTRVAVLSVNGSWCRVLHDGTDGWVRTRYLHFDKLAHLGKGLLSALVTVLLGVTAAAGFGAWHSRRHAASRAAPTLLRAASRTVLVVRRTPGFVKQYISGDKVTFESCLREVGFRVDTAATLTAVRDTLRRGAPDIILVDYRFHPHIHTAFAQLLAVAARSDQRAPLLIVYRVPPERQVALLQQLPTAHCLGPGVTDRELFAPITPHIVVARAVDALPPDEHASALEGPLAAGGLTEILQFIEIGAKTGRLTVNNGTPTGAVYFSHGMIVHAATADATGKQAVFKMLEMEQGSFRFVHQEVPRTGGYLLPTLQVLMEWAQARDEARRVVQ
ncbi:MAG: DUF4388 domain-containing protein [Chitinivibrionales bacterium]|nr:DUF4388 domain-containing protein [Chitinivibrionales bacterium]